MVKIYILIILLLLPLTMRSQEDINIGKKYKLASIVLQQERCYWVHLPENYSRDTTRAYPVIYLLDGDSFFHVLVGMNRTLASGRGKYFPPSIIVGVLNTDRTRDLTPSVSAAGRDGKISADAIPQGGGSEYFTRFLIEELCAEIEANYRTDGKRMLIGHSYGGLFVINTFLHHTELFDSYLAIDPSLWWDQGKLAKESQELILKKDFTGKNLYIGIAAKKRNDRVSIHLNEIECFLSKVLPQAKNLHFFTRSYPDKDHGTVAIPGIYDGIIQLLNNKDTD